MTDGKKPDVILSDGNSIVFNKLLVKQKEIKQLLRNELNEEQENELMGRFSQTSAEYVDNLNRQDWEVFSTAMLKKLAERVDPNLPSESTSQ